MNFSTDYKGSYGRMHLKHLNVPCWQVQPVVLRAT